MALELPMPTIRFNSDEELPTPKNAASDPCGDDASTAAPSPCSSLTMDLSRLSSLASTPDVSPRRFSDVSPRRFSDLSPRRFSDASPRRSTLPDQLLPRCTEAKDLGPVLQAGIAANLGVDQDAVVVTGVRAAEGRRLQATGVKVDYYVAQQDAWSRALRRLEQISEEMSLDHDEAEGEEESPTDEKAERKAETADQAKDQEEVEEPALLLCPITNVMFRDPVFLASGNTYEREAIEQHTRLRATDPLTNTELPHAFGKETLGLPNLLVRRLVQDFLDKHPGYIPDGWDDRTLPKATVLRREAPPELPRRPTPPAVRGDRYFILYPLRSALIFFACVFIFVCSASWIFLNLENFVGADLMYVRGIMYEEGLLGVPSDAARAAEMYGLAMARGGHADAACRLGTMHALGNGVATDAARAQNLFRLAADQGSRSAGTNLMVMRANEGYNAESFSNRKFTLKNEDFSGLCGERCTRFLLLHPGNIVEAQIKAGFTVWAAETPPPSKTSVVRPEQLYRAMLRQWQKFTNSHS